VLGAAVMGWVMERVTCRLQHACVWVRATAIQLRACRRTVKMITVEFQATASCRTGGPSDCSGQAMIRIKASQWRSKCSDQTRFSIEASQWPSEQLLRLSGWHSQVTWALPPQ
jgi:hypothetical protein